MSFDAYTKGVLTVIAAALCALVAQNAILQSKAESGPLQKVQICDEHDCVRLSPIRKHSTVGGYFLTFGLPTFAETEDR
jgi:hypothetical protein